MCRPGWALEKSCQRVHDVCVQGALPPPRLEEGNNRGLLRSRQRNHILGCVATSPRGARGSLVLTTKRLRHFPRKSRNRYRPSLTRPSRPEFCTNSFSHSAPHASPCLVCLVPHLTVERRKGKLQFKTIALGYISTPAEERSTRTPRRCCRRFRHGLRLESYGSSPAPTRNSFPK